MLTKSPPMTSTERQRQFRERHLGYDARRKAAERAGLKVAAELMQAEQILALQAAAVRREPLLLPAPVEPLVFTWTTDAGGQREAVCVERVAASGSADLFQWIPQSD